MLIYHVCLNAAIQMGRKREPASLVAVPLSFVHTNEITRCRGNPCGCPLRSRNPASALLHLLPHDRLPPHFATPLPVICWSGYTNWFSRGTRASRRTANTRSPRNHAPLRGSRRSRAGPLSLRALSLSKGRRIVEGAALSLSKGQATADAVGDVNASPCASSMNKHILILRSSHTLRIYPL